MPATIIFDSLKFVKKLTDAGIPQNQAEAQAMAFKEAHEENLDRLATKDDLNEFGNNLRFEMSELKISMIKWVLSIVFAVSSAQTAVIFSIMKVLH